MTAEQIEQKFNGKETLQSLKEQFNEHKKEQQ